MLLFESLYLMTNLKILLKAFIALRNKQQHMVTVAILQIKCTGREINLIKFVINVILLLQLMQKKGFGDPEIMAL